MMNLSRFPELDPAAIGATRDALHAYSLILGDCLKATRTRRKHWWHASLRPSLNGLTTGVVRSAVDFEVELDLVANRLRARTVGDEVTTDLAGQSAASLASGLDEVLREKGVDLSLEDAVRARGSDNRGEYSPNQAMALHAAFASVSAALEDFRAGIREETSPVQVWPHHFDLSMIWLPGHKIADQDPADEEYADKQMNFGFVFGDDGIAEPYLYVTAYPLPGALPNTDLPAGTTWRSDGFSGAVLLYRDLAAMSDPGAYLQDLWARLYAAGQTHLATDE